MKTSVRWINDYLDPPASADEQAELLTRAGLPFDGRETIDDDIQQEIETTSNRGDCLCHLGMAREVAALSGRSLRAPAPHNVPTGPKASTVVTVTNERPDLCPLYTARVIRGVRIGRSPDWLATRLRAIGQIPRNNVVDATNFALFEWGQPTHVFDLAKLEGPSIVVRLARAGEAFLPIGEGSVEVRLRATDLVIADASRAVAIAGVKGGALTAVTDRTTDILIEAATFDPLAVRSASRGLRIASDSSYRFERGVHPAQVDVAAERLVELILASAGGTLCEGSVSAGGPMPAPRRVSLRLDRCRRLLGIELATERMLEWLSTLGFEPVLSEDVAVCTVPPQRLDIEREIDLVEEIARMAGLDLLPVADTIAVRLAAPQPRVTARRAIRDALAGIGYVETITHSLVSEAAALPFVPSGAAPLRVGDERAGLEPILRPSIVPSLLRVRRHNQDGGVDRLALFELATVFHLQADGVHHEHESLALVADRDGVARATGKGDGDALRILRGTLERLVALLAGSDARLEVLPIPDPSPGASPDAPAGWLDAEGVVQVEGRSIGRLGIVHPTVQRQFGLDAPVVAAEIRLAPLLDRYPPETTARALPAFPAIERDISAIVDENVAWRNVREALVGLRLPHLEDVDFVTVFRGKPIPSARKSLTLRLRFRAADRTLRHEEIEPGAAAAAAELRSHFGAEIRG